MPILSFTNDKASSEMYSTCNWDSNPPGSGFVNLCDAVYNKDACADYSNSLFDLLAIDELYVWSFLSSLERAGSA